MAKYGAPYYGRPLYGISPFRDFSVEPMSSVAIDFDKVRIEWQAPSGLYSQARLVRNQNGFPQTPEDGIIIWQEDTLLDTDPLSSNVSRNQFVDGIDNTNVPADPNLQQGREVFYRLFLFSYNDKVWEPAGQTYVLVPNNTGVHEKLLSFLPRVFTSAEQNPLEAIDYNSDLAKFLEGISFTYETFLTLIDLLTPDNEKANFPYQLLAIEQFNLGFNTPEVTLPVINQKRLIRESLGLYAERGTARGLQNYIESLTGYNAVVTVSDNLMLTVQDATFYGGIGNWDIDNSGTIEVSDDEAPLPNDNLIDEEFAGKITSTGAGSMTLGADDITKSVPIQPEQDYTVSLQVKSPAEDGEITINVYFLDHHGNEVIPDDPVTATTSDADDTWQLLSVTFTAPDTAYYASLEIGWDAAGVFFVDEICFQLGDEVLFAEARAIDFTLESNKTNYIRNPSFELGTDYWTETGSPTITTDTDSPETLNSGTDCAKIVASGNWTFTSTSEALTKGRFYTGSAYLKGTGNRYLRLVTFEDDLTPVDTFEVEVTLSDTEWTRFSISAVLPVDGDATRVAVEIAGGAGTTFIDAVQLEENFKASDYFDGSYSSEYNAIWEDAPFESYSHEYPEKVRKTLRLAQTMEDWIPMNTFWIMRDEQGPIYTNLTI